MSNDKNNLRGLPACKACTPSAENVRRRATTIREIVSAFEDAPPVRVHGDGSQTYGPYTNDT